jgi:glutathione peroxidase
VIIVKNEVEVPFRSIIVRRFVMRTKCSKLYWIIPILALSLSTPTFSANATKSAKESKPVKASVYSFTMKDIDGKEVPLSKYKGKVVMIVNVASKCGFTPQYEQLEAVYEKYKDKGLVILGFPANNFKGQEPGTNEEIKQFCTSKYGVKFPMFDKISVNGDDINPFYVYLTAKETDPQFAGPITWNFNKFLIDKNGNIIARYDSKIKPDDPQVTTDIEAAIK